MKITITKRSRRGGYIWIVLAIIIALVAGVIIYELYRLVQRVLPDKPGGGGNGSSTFYNNNGVITGGPVVPDIVSSPANLLNPDDLAPSTNSFVLQYEVLVYETNCITTVQVGTGLQEGYIIPLVNNSNEYSFVFTSNDGQVSYYDYNAVDGTLLTNTVTPAYADTNNPYVSVTLRSTNMVNWIPIYTNLQYMPGTIDTVIDANPPLIQGFYRVGIYPPAN